MKKRKKTKFGVIKRVKGEIPESTTQTPSCENCGSEDIQYLNFDEVKQENMLHCNECGHEFEESLM